jgi:hypothetical protein
MTATELKLRPGVLTPIGVGHADAEPVGIGGRERGYTWNGVPAARARKRW